MMKSNSLIDKWTKVISPDGDIDCNNELVNNIATMLSNQEKLERGEIKSSSMFDLLKRNAG